MTRFELYVPELGLGPTPITVGAWLVRRGQRVERGESVVELVTGDAVVDLEAPADGVLLRKCAGEDDAVAVGDRLAVFDRAEDSAADEPPVE